ncbi:MAG: TRAP transporter TatT component family protein, partial [Acidiferrobacterales bacterium]
MRPNPPTLRVVVIGSKVVCCLPEMCRLVLALAHRQLMILLIGLLLVSPTVIFASDPSPLSTDMQQYSTRFHENPSRLREIREELERRIKTNSHMEYLVALAKVCFILGDVLATTDIQKADAFERGRQVAERAVELEPKNVSARFWYASNTGRWGQSKGFLRSLFLVPTVKKEINIILKLDPNFTPAYALAGNFFYEVPGLFGGDLDKAEEMFRKGLEQDSTFTGLRVGLAKTLIKKGRDKEAQQQLQAVLDEKEPRNLAYWTLKDSKEAQELLDSIKKRSEARD